jgi:hypothetical protein
MQMRMQHDAETKVDDHLQLAHLPLPASSALITPKKSRMGGNGVNCSLRTG